MNKIIILNLVWLGVAIAAFMVGRSDDTSSAEAIDQTSESGRRVASSRRGGSGGGGDSADSKSSQGGKGSRNSSGVTISQYQNETDALLANKMFADLLLELKPENAQAMFEALLDKDKNCLLYTSPSPRDRG